MKIGPLALLWDDHPTNWIESRWFRHERRFHNGPLRAMTVTFRLFPAGTGSRGEYTLEVETANILGNIMFALGFFDSTRRKFARLAGNAGDFAGGRRATAFDISPPNLPSGARERALEAAARIEAGPYGHGLAYRLAEHVLHAQEVDLWTIRPLGLARLWGVPDRHAVELCLDAVKRGLLGLRWDLLCPRCRVGKESVAALDHLPKGAHCSSCNIDYGRDYTKNIELAFHPAQAIRPIESGQFCLYGPRSTPHVKAQITLAPGETREEEIALGRGVFRIRTLEPGGESVVDGGGGEGAPIIVVEGEKVRAGGRGPPGRIVMENRLDRPRTVVLEERAWARDALTAHRATTLQAFRDLFTEEVLRPGDDVAIDSVTMMFTDLKGSTALYDRIGDTVAYVLVREHYAIIGAAVRECDGAVVKTIGDAVMASFLTPADAFRCGVRIQDDFAAYNTTSGKEPAVIKLGFHTGRCISVTLNNRLDYYGSAANMAARLQGCSQGRDMVLSMAAAADPEVAPLLAVYPPVVEEAVLKGFAHPVTYYRVTAETLAARRVTRSPAQQRP
jgi:class 3 adenylate cyclase